MSDEATPPETTDRTADRTAGWTADRAAARAAGMKPRIVVMGVGGGGGNAVSNMLAAGLIGPKFIVANTDAQALAASAADHRIQLGVRATDGIGAGAKHEIGEAAAEEALDEIRSALSGAHMVFIAAGMGGGTGTGATPVIARVAKDLGILTVAVVTKPFLFEGKRRMRTADAGIAELRRHVDTLIVIPNQNLFKIADERTAFAEAFVLADQVLYAGVACIVDLVVRDALINLDLADVRTVLTGMGTAMMGTGEASGDNRAVTAAKDAIFNPLLDDVSLRGAKSLLLSIGGGQDLTLFEVHDAVDLVRQEVDPEANIIFGATLDDSLTGRIRVSVVASGMHRAEPGAERPANPAAQPHGLQGRRASSRLPSRPEAGSARVAVGSRAAVERPRRDEPRRAPGDVVIREKPPQLPGSPPQPAHARPGGRDDNHMAETQPHRGERQVERPGDRYGERTRRPMPSVEDFPLVGQREYWAKIDGASRPETPPPEPPQRKAGLFQRLTRGGRDRRADSHQPVERAQDEPIDLPVFFRRDQGA
jgi:cell division protein FtsZ